MNTVRVKAYAKLNLTLDIKGTEKGYHLLDSIVTTVGVSDGIKLKKRKDRLVSAVVRGAFIPPEENNAVRAAGEFIRTFSTDGVDITIDKNIPIAAGMGGSSADIAGVIAGMGRLFHVKDEAALKAVADRAGSDSGYLLRGGLARLGGRGDIISPLPFRPMHFLILVPEEGVSSRDCYAEYDRLPAKGERSEEAERELRAGGVMWAAGRFGNDLFAPAKRLLPAIGQAYGELSALSPLGVGMTGSGSGVFALFETKELALWAKSRYQGNCRAIVAESVPQGVAFGI